MSRFDVTVQITLREGIAVPEGATIERALPALGFVGVSDVRVGKTIRFAVDAESPDAARAQAEAMCERLLANPVIEDSEVAVVTGTTGTEAR